MLETPVMFAGIDLLWHAIAMSSPCSETQPQPEPWLITAITLKIVSTSQQQQEAQLSPRDRAMRRVS